MIFSHDTEVALTTAAALVNTGSPPEGLPTVADLDDFIARFRFSGSRTRDDAELVAVQDLRPRLRAIWTASRDDAPPLINQLLADGHALPYLVRHDEWDWHVHATTADQPLAVRMGVEAAMAFIDVIREGEWARMRICAAGDCDDVVIDLSRNRSRRYCEAGCGNRTNVAAFRARARAQ